MRNISFERKKEMLLASYKSIPVKSLTNLFVERCFLSFNEHDEKYYKNLTENDRKMAYFSLHNSNEARDYYYSSFLDRSENTLISYDMFDMTPNKFEDINISNLSKDILNFVYFEYYLNKVVNEFKTLFNDLKDEFKKTNRHQLLALEDEFNKVKASRDVLEDDEAIIDGLDYPKFYDLLETSQNELNEFVESKFDEIRANARNITSIHNQTRERNLLRIIDNASLDLYYMFEKWLVKNEYLDEDNLTWIDSGGKSSFMRFYLKLEDHQIVKRGGGIKRNKKIRVLSDIYKIDGVVQYDYTPKNCQKAKDKYPEEFRDLDYEKSQFDLNSKKS